MEAVKMKIKEAFPIVAQALGGRFGVEVVIGGNDASTNGKTVWLPAIAADSHLKEVAWGFLVHEAAHVRFTEFFTARRGDELRNSIWNVLEDARVETAISREYPGTRAMLDETLTYMVKEKRITAPKEGDHPARVLTGYLLTYLRGNVLGQEAATSLVDAAEVAMEATFPQGVVTKLAAQLPRVVNLRSTAETLQMADDIVRLLEEEAEAEKDEQPSDGDDDSSGEGQGQASKTEGGESSDGDDDSSDEGQGQASKTEGGESSDDLGVSGKGGDPGAGSGQDSKVKALRATLAAEAGDLPADVFGQVRDDLIEEALQRPGVAPLNLKRVEIARHMMSADKTGAIVESAKIRAALQGLVQSHRRDRAMWKRTGNRVSHSRLARIAVGDSRVFRKELKREAPNTAVDILVDLSGSMNCTGPSGVMADVALEAALALALGLEGVAGVSPAVSAFGALPTDRGKGGDVLGVIVRHGERVRSRLDSFRLYADGSTPLAEALLALLPSLLARREERKQVIVVTDGDPNDHLAALEIIRAAEDVGVEMVGVGIGTFAVKSLFKRWTVIGSVTDLKKSLFEIAEGLLLAA